MATLATDDFNSYPDDHLGAGPANTNWSNFGANGLDTVSGAIKPEVLLSDGGDVFDGVAFPNDQWAQVTYTSVDSGVTDQAGLGLLLRGNSTLSDASRNGYRIVFNSASTNNISVAKYVTGTYTLLGQITKSLVNGDVLYAQIVGSTIKVFVNGVQAGSDIIDAGASIASGFPGVSTSSPVQAGALLDNFSAGSVEVAAPITQPIRQQFPAQFPMYRGLSQEIIRDIIGGFAWVNNAETQIRRRFIYYRDTEEVPYFALDNSTPVGTQYPDSDTVYVDIQVDTSDFTQLEASDSATVYIDIQVSDVQAADLVDAATVYVDIQPNTVDTAQYVDGYAPNTTAIVDNANRANENPLSNGGFWTTGGTGSGTHRALRVVSNQITGTNANVLNLAYASGPYGPDCEVYGTYATIPDTSTYIRWYLRASGLGGDSQNGFVMQWANDSNGLRIWKDVSGTLTVLAQDVNARMTDGDVITFSAIANTLTVYKNGVIVLQVQDTTYTAAGDIGVGYRNSTGAIDDIGLGTVIIPGPVLITITPSGTDVLEKTDADTVYVDIQPSDTQVFEAVDSATVYIDIQVSSVDVADTVDAATVYVDLQAIQTAEEHTTYDAQEVYYDIQVASTDVADLTDANTVYVDIQTSATDILEAVDQATVYYDIQLSDTQVFEAVDAATGYITITVTSADIAQYVEAATVYYDIQVASDEQQSGAASDANTVEIFITPSATDILEAIESAEVYIDIQPSDTQVFIGVDQATGVITITVTSADVAVFTDAATVYYDIQPSGTDDYTAAQAFLDSATIYYDIQLSDTQIADLADAAECYVNLEAFSTDTAQYTDTATVNFVITPDSSEELVAGETNTVYFDIQPDSAEVVDLVDSAEIYYDIQVIPAEFLSRPELLGVFYIVAAAPRWFIEGHRRWSVEASSSRWRIDKMLPRWLWWAAAPRSKVGGQ